ncbi:MAG: hypothetical protein LBB65_00525 [Burkholderiales bacterium]|nr:hypothetical protein [Burkholderiales bacterium]
MAQARRMSSIRTGARRGESPARSAALSFAERAAEGEKKRQEKQWNVIGGMLLSFKDGLRRRKAKPKNPLTVKVTGCSMESRLFNGGTVAIDRLETRNRRKIEREENWWARVSPSGKISAKRLLAWPDGLRQSGG